MTECLICLDELKDKDPNGRAWLSCECKPQYHATCIHEWMYKGTPTTIIKSCPICKDPETYIEDFLPPCTPPPPPQISPKPKQPEPKKLTRFEKFLKRFKQFMS